jgi:hypothetical protein
MGGAKRVGLVACSMYRARYTDKKEKKIFLIVIYKEIPMGAVAKSYMRKANI